MLADQHTLTFIISKRILCRLEDLAWLIGTDARIKGIRFDDDDDVDDNVDDTC